MLKPGERFERYTIEGLLGEGGMGAVYRAFDPRLGRRVALKVISGKATAEADARLLREARAAAALDHPNAVAIYDVGEHEGSPYIVMELVDGHTLRGAVGASLPVEARVAQLTDVARALSGAHKRGLVHRDIKPENVMVRNDGVVKVLDFGIARRTSADVDPHASTQTPALPTLTIDGVKLGTPVYMAPEQIRGDALDGRADQFSWGVLAYELLAGRLPWRGAGDPMAVMASVLTDPLDASPLDKANVPPAVQEVVKRALSKRPDDRFASMDELLRALDAAAKGEAPAKPPSATEAQQFTTGEVREVIGKAVERTAEAQGSTKLRFEDLLSIAEEVGIDPESLREASRALRARGAPPASPAAPPAGSAQADRLPAGSALVAPADKRDEAARRDAWLRRERRDFYRHAGVYVIINAALLVLGWVLLSFTYWWIWPIPALAWGVGLAIHALVAFTTNEEDWREHEEGVRWWKERGRRRHEERMAAIAAARGAVASVGGAIEAVTGRRQDRRQRVQAPPEREDERIRVAAPTMDTGRERAAEEEAARAEERKAERRRR